MAQPLNGLALLQQYQAQDQARQLGDQQLQMAPVRQQMLMEEMAMKRQAAERDTQRMGMLQRLQEGNLARQDRAQGATERYQQGRLAQMAAAAGRPRPQTVPAGYRPTKDGLEPIPGGPADTKIQGALNQDTSMLQNSQGDLDRLALEANRLLTHPGLSKTTGIMSAVPLVGGVATIPGTEAANFKAGLDTLKSQTGFSVLQNMRNNSKTGGALGQVSDFENKMLQANLASLNMAQSEPEFKAALSKIIKYTDDAKGRLQSAYNMKHNGRQPQNATASAPAAAPAQQGGWSIRPIQ